MTLCFAALIKVLKTCSKQGVGNKHLCGAFAKTVNKYYGDNLETDDNKVGGIMSCRDNLSYIDFVTPAKESDLNDIRQKIGEYVMPLLIDDDLPPALLALRDLALDTVKRATSRIGNMKRSDLESRTVYNPVSFLTDIFIYTTTVIENKKGKGTIDQITEDYVHSFDTASESIQIVDEDIIEMEELSCMLDDAEFRDIFKEVSHPATLALKNKSGISLYYLDIADSEFDYNALNDYLFDCMGMYVFSRATIKEFEDKNKTRSIGARALRLMQSNGQPGEKGTGNELGEMLLFPFMECGLHAPKLMSKVEINATNNGTSSYSDSVHLLKRQVNGTTSYQLVYGTSCIDNDIKSGIDRAFDILVKIKQGKKNERRMVDRTLFNHSFDTETNNWLSQILIPDGSGNSNFDMAFGVFIGYSLNIDCDDNDAYRQAAVKKMQEDIVAAAPYIAQRAAELKLGMHSHYFYFLPFNDAENDKERIMEELLKGGAY